MPLVIQTCRLASFLHVTKFKIHRNSLQPFKTIDKKGRIYNSTKLEYRACIYLIFIILFFLQYVQKTILSLEETVLFSFTLVAHLAFACFIYANETKSVKITFYINSLFQFDSMYSNVSSARKFNSKFKTVYSLQEKMSLLLVKCSCLTSVILPVLFVYGTHWTNPCQATLLGFPLLQECHTVKVFFHRIPSICLKITLFLVNHWFWMFGIQGTFVGLLLVNTLSIICIHEYIKRYY